ncbi:MAG: hypothetical protein ACLFUY_08390 [Desulfobacterales bacterium]
MWQVPVEHRSGRELEQLSRRRRVEVAALGRVDQLAVSVAAANIQAILGLMARVVPPWPDPDYAVLPGRSQYNAIPILKDLSRDLEDDTLRLGIISADLCLPFLSFVYGEAQIDGKAAVISLHRLRRGSDGKTAPSALFLQRLAKVAIHETAHVIGMTHCRKQGCIMCFSLELESLDALSMAFCPECDVERRQLVRA